MARLTSPIDDPPRTYLCCLPVLKTSSWPFSCVNIAAHPPAPQPGPPVPGESRDAGLGGTHPAGGEAPERLAAPMQHSGKERSRGRRGGAGGKRETQPGRGLQPPSPGRPCSLLATNAKSQDRTHGLAPSAGTTPPPPCGRAPPSPAGGARRPIPCDWAGLRWPPRAARSRRASDKLLNWCVAGATAAGGRLGSSRGPGTY